VSLTGLPSEAYVADARIGAASVLAGGVRVSSGAGLLEFHISGSGSRIDGTVQVREGAVFTGAQVVLVPDDPALSSRFAETTPDQYGRFSMQGVAPGRYRIFAWEDAPSGAYRDPEFVRQYRDFGEALTIEQGGSVTLQPRLIPAGR
jgi:hypothetical protein